MFVFHPPIKFRVSGLLSDYESPMDNVTSCKPNLVEAILSSFITETSQNLYILFLTPCEAWNTNSIFIFYC